MNNVLTDQNYRDINKALNSLAAGRRLIELAEQSGQDMKEYTEAYDNVENRLNGLKRVFFPDRR